MKCKFEIVYNNLRNAAECFGRFENLMEFKNETKQLIIRTLVNEIVN